MVVIVLILVHRVRPIQKDEANVVNNQEKIKQLYFFTINLTSTILQSNSRNYNKPIDYFINYRKCFKKWVFCVTLHR